ncbi:MAG: hypothetical protein AUK29_08045 [Nitrospirae bacterium CG2_30_53_67]|nr:MAG: hypothetical protein AUK29_08045 [Nitrospirae bacterium CG2_30_53_67]
MYRICIIGNFSGRNAGDAAILGGLLHDLSKRYSGCTFLIPTINTRFVAQTYAAYNVTPVGLMPWNLSVKIFGWPLLRSVLSADLILVTDAILFDYKLMNPLYNYLSTLALALPLAKKRGIPVVLYNVSLGPVYTKIGRSCLNRVLNSSEIVLLRDRESRTLLQELQPSFPSERVFQTADCALNTIPGDQDRLVQIQTKEGILTGSRPWMSFNISSYIDVYMRGYKGKGFGRDKFLEIMARVLESACREFGVNPLMVVTQPMDIPINKELLARARDGHRVKIISNTEYSYRDLALVLSKVDLHIGMRTHSLILASSVLTPVVGIIATPKNRGFMCSIEQEERMIEFDHFSEEIVHKVLQTTWYNRHKIKQGLAPIIAREKKKAEGAADLLRKYLCACSGEAGRI